MGLGTTTLTNARRGLSRYIGDLDVTLQLTTAIAADKKLISTKLSNLFPNDAMLEGHWAYIQDFANAQAERLITTYTGSTGLCLTAGEVFATDSANKATIEIHRIISPKTKNDLLDDARDMLFPALYKRLEDDTLTAHVRQSRYTLPTVFKRPPQQIYLVRPPDPASAENMIANGDMEDGTNKWVGTNVTISQEQITGGAVNERVYSGNSSLKCVSTAATAGDVLNEVAKSNGADWGVGDLKGQRIAISAVVYSRTKDVLKAIIKIAGGTDAKSGFHTGTGWELLTIATDIPNAATKIEVGIDVISASPAITFWTDHVFLIGATERASQPATPLFGWGVFNDVISFPYALPDKYILRLIGYDLLTSMSAEADTIELDGDYLQLLYAQAAVLAYERLVSDHSSQEIVRFLNLRTHFERKLRTALTGFRMASIPKQGKIPGWGTSGIPVAFP